MTNNMPGRPMVSVVMPFLNAVRFMQEAIESVFAQTFQRWELLVVDDGSTDGSTSIARRYAAQYPEKVRYLEHDGRRNRGAAATRNLGIRNAQGEYVALLDSDDVWLPEKLSRQVEILSMHPEAAMVYGPSLKWYSWTGNPDDAPRDLMYVLGVDADRAIEPPTMLSLSLRGQAIVPSMSNIIFRREMIGRVGGFEESFTGMYEDHAFIAKVHLKERVFVLSECLDKYRRHPDSSVAVARSQGKEGSARFFYLRWLENYLSEPGMKRTEVWEALQAALWPYRHPLLRRLGDGFRRLRKDPSESARSIVRRILPASSHRWLKVVLLGHQPSDGKHPDTRRTQGQ